MTDKAESIRDTVYCILVTKVYDCCEYPILWFKRTKDSEPMILTEEIKEIVIHGNIVQTMSKKSANLGKYTSRIAGMSNKLLSYEYFPKLQRIVISTEKYGGLDVRVNTN